MNMLSYDQVKTTLNVNDATLKHWAATGELRPIDRSMMYRGDEVGLVKLVLTLRRG